MLLLRAHYQQCYAPSENTTILPNYLPVNYYLVHDTGIEPVKPEATDLQSATVIQSCLSYVVLVVAFSRSYGICWNHVYLEYHVGFEPDLRDLKGR